MKILAEDLSQMFGILCSTYHVSMKDDERKEIQFKWIIR